MMNYSRVPPNEKDWIICAGLKKSNETIWNLMLDIYKRTKDENVLESLSCRDDEKTLTKYLKLITEDDNNNLILGSKILDVLHFASKTNVDLTLKFINTNRQEIKEK